MALSMMNWDTNPDPRTTETTFDRFSPLSKLLPSDVLEAFKKTSMQMKAVMLNAWIIGKAIFLVDPEIFDKVLLILKSLEHKIIL